MKNFKILAINPGSTSTKIALFENEEKIFYKNINHAAEELNKFPQISDQLPYRTKMILNVLSEVGIQIESIDAFAGRGGSIQPSHGGTYLVSEKLISDTLNSSIKHPANLGCQIADAFAREYGVKAFIVNSPRTDEFCDLARITGVKGIYRESSLHALNQKEIGIRYAASKNRKYEDLDLIICHIGGGVSVTAHQHGKMIDSNDIVQGDGPMAPTRCGALPVKDVIKMCFSGKYTQTEISELTSKNGGWVSHLGISDAREVLTRIDSGDQYAKFIYDATIYQVAKAVGSCAAVLKGKAEAVILTGGVSNDPYFTNELTNYVSSLAPVVVMAGEFEMEALAAGVLRVLMGEESAKEYTGIPSWNVFSFTHKFITKQ